MLAIYFLIFWIPAIAAGIALWLAWGQGLLARPVGSFAWFAVALVLQVTRPTFSPLWAVGLALQTILAVYLTIKLKLER